MKHRYTFPIAVRRTRAEIVSGQLTVMSDEAMPDDEIEETRSRVQKSLNSQILDKPLVKGEFVVQAPKHRLLKR